MQENHWVLLQMDMHNSQKHILVVARQPLFRQGIIAFLSQMGGGTIVDQADDSGKALDIAQAKRPVVVLLDTFGSDAATVTFMQHLRTSSPGTALIILSELKEEERLFIALNVGAVACCSRSISGDELIEVVRRAERGEYLINAGVLPLKSLMKLPSENVPVCPLSARELEVLTLAARGETNKEIAATLKISDQTVKNHMTAILQKCEGIPRDRTGAVVYAIRKGWIQVK